ncbi:hypothetical protein LAZ67_6003126 [Cordylochernes scorpioides]|uniref:Protein LTV1 homolog n=1 Tax=Cordylochernes scorpioides TaxID=51811 RepID=A0ABY6KKA9_9ARAC|nr:hypothetical protein LAZ67_6003126 [Cordylochernes scorpioides]
MGRNKNKRKNENAKLITMSIDDFLGAEVPELSKEERKLEQEKYGVFFNDDYDYLAHLKSVEETDERIYQNTTDERVREVLEQYKEEAEREREKHRDQLENCEVIEINEDIEPDDIDDIDELDLMLQNNKIEEENGGLISNNFADVTPNDQMDDYLMEKLLSDNVWALTKGHEDFCDFEENSEDDDGQDELMKKYSHVFDDDSESDEEFEETEAEIRENKIREEHLAQLLTRNEEKKCEHLKVTDELISKTIEMAEKYEAEEPIDDDTLFKELLGEKKIMPNLKLAEFLLKMILGKNAQNVQKITDLIKENPRTTLLELEQDTGISKTTIGRIVTKDLKLKKTPAKFIPRFLTNEQNLCRLATCENMLEMTRTDPEWKDKIITGDETWVYDYDPETKRQYAEWRGQAGETLLTVLEGNLQGKRPKGRRRQGYTDDLKQWNGRHTYEELKRMAEDREVWPTLSRGRH